MKTSQVTLENKVEYCTHSEPIDTYFRCKLTDFGFIFRCTKQDRLTCPDLDYFKQQKERNK